jgi:phospholipid/cholesterol/gamma-HCH transport system permease protein
MLTAVKKHSAQILERVGDYSSLVFDVFFSALKRPPSWILIQEQLYNIGVLSFSVVAITGFTTGFVLAAQSFYQLGEKGMAGVTGILVAKSMITELGPILTAFMVTGRVGSSMCAELGTMKVTEQIDALKSMAINPNAYLVAPRFIAGIFMIPLLTIFCIVMGIFGGYLIAVQFFNLSYATYFNPMQAHITVFDVITGVTKSVIFGIILVTVCCYRGMRTTGGAAGVGKATTQSVVTSYVLILIADFFLTMGMNIVRQELKNDWMKGL